MGASTNPNAARLAALQERRQAIEESLAKRNEELRQLCIQEAELTGSMPLETPLERREASPVHRRCIGTTYKLSENLINLLYNEDESINSIELNMQVQANLAEAALGLANESSISKTIRRQHMVEYQHHKKQFTLLEEKLSFLKAHAQMAQHNNMTLPSQAKQRKKPRPTIQADSISLNVNMQHHAPFEHLALRHSMRSLQHPLTGDISSQGDLCNYKNLIYRNSDSTMYRPEDSMVSGIYRLSLYGYNAYMERKENTGIIGNGSIQTQYIQPQYNPNLHQQQLSYLQMASHTLPHSAQHMHHSYQGLTHHNSNFNVHSLHEYSSCTSQGNAKTIMKLSSSPSSNSQASVYSKSPSGSFTSHSRQSAYIEQQYRNSNLHQLQPHQRYEPDVTVGLGGCWKRMESGELIWCNSVQSDTWQCDKRFGSLDRRRNRIQKRNSPLAELKSSSISVTIPYPEFIKSSTKPQQMSTRSQQEARQLVRTQSLGSVGAQTVDSIWPSDDNSSCGSDALSINETSSINKKHKQKEWIETSLDGPSLPITIRTHSNASSVTSTPITPISAEEKYTESPSLYKPILEIPAESKPNVSHGAQERNIELFNNNIPRNGTLIQVGQCKPYHEETKPFEMSDFYKYSTKFKKGNKQENQPTFLQGSLSPSVYKAPTVNSNDSNAIIIQKGIYQPLQSLECQPLSSNSLNNSPATAEILKSSELIRSPELKPIITNIAENFPNEMNDWYQNQGDDNNNTRQSPSNGRSTATLV